MIPSTIVHTSLCVGKMFLQVKIQKLWKIKYSGMWTPLPMEILMYFFLVILTKIGKEFFYTLYCTVWQNFYWSTWWGRPCHSFRNNCRWYRWMGFPYPHSADNCNWNFFWYKIYRFGDSFLFECGWDVQSYWIKNWTYIMLNKNDEFVETFLLLLCTVIFSTAFFLTS